MQRALIALILSLVITSSLSAEKLSAAEPDTPLQKFLKRWTEDARDLQEVRVAVRSIHYDKVFRTISQGSGEMGVQPGGRGWIRLEGTNPEPGKAVMVDGQQYRLIPGASEECYSTGQLIYMVNRDARTYWTIPTSQTKVENRERSGQFDLTNVARETFETKLRWMFLTPPSLEELQAQFNISFETAKEGQVRLRLKPRLLNDWCWVHEIHVIIDANTLRTQAVKFVDPTEGKTIVYVVKNKRVLRAPADPSPVPIPDLKALRDQRTTRETVSYEPPTTLQCVYATVVGLAIAKWICF